MSYFLKTSVNEWDVKKAFNHYLMDHDADQCIREMKKDLVDTKNSDLLSAKMKLKCEQFLFLIDKKSSEMNSQQQKSSVVLQQHHNQTVNNNINSVVSIENGKRKDSSSSSTQSKHNKKQKKREEQEMRQVFEDSSSSTLNLPHLPSRIEDLHPDDYDVEVKEPLLINGTNVNTSFSQYQMAIVNMNNRGGLLVECNPHELLAINNILLLKEGQHSDTLLQFFNEETLDAIAASMKSKFNVKDIIMDAQIKTELETIIMSLIKKKITTKEAKTMTDDLISKDAGFNFTDVIINGVSNLISNIPKLKFNGLVRESHLISAYAHSLLSPMFNNPDKRKHLQWLNIKTTDESSKQPDVVCRNLLGANWGSFIMVGEVKGEDQKEDKRVCLLDLIRIGCISAAEIKDVLLEGIIGVHIVGLQMTFYITSLVADHIYAMTEICSFALPRDQSELCYYTVHIGDIYNVLQYSQKCVPAVDKEGLKKKAAAPLDTPEFERFLSITKDRKRKCPIVYHH